MLRVLDWFRKLWPRKLRVLAPAAGISFPEGCQILVSEGLEDARGRRTTQITIITERPEPGGDVWKRYVRHQSAGGPLVVNVSRLKTVRGKGNEEGGSGKAD